jgi:predicted  nucleic acid-binding Zn ribbon protein
MGEKTNYVTCPKGHKVYVVWSPMRKVFAFTCDECGEHSEKAFSEFGLISIRVEKPMVRA